MALFAVFLSALARELRALGDIIVPPRRTETLVRRISERELLAIARSAKTAEGIVFSLPYHDARVTALVWEFKYHAAPEALSLVAPLIAEEITACVAECLGKPLLIPVPMSKKRRKTRGHNQTEALCKAALRKLSADMCEYAPGALLRVRETLPQQGLPRAKRLHNVSGAMQADEKVVRGRSIIVLDDVTTTGATLEEAKRALLAAGATEVHLLALAG